MTIAKYLSHVKNGNSLECPNPRKPPSISKIYVLQQILVKLCLAHLLLAMTWKIGLYTDKACEAFRFNLNLLQQCVSKVLD